MNKKLANWLLGGSGAGYSAEFQLVIDRANTEGYAQGDLSKGDTLMRAIQSQLINLDVLFIFWNSGSSGYGNINWVNPSGNLAVPSSATWTSNVGYTTDGAATYINSNYVLNTLTKYTIDDASMGCYIKTNITGVADVKAAFGARNVIGGAVTACIQRSTGAFRYPVNNTTVSSVASGVTSFANNSWHIVKRVGITQSYIENKTVRSTFDDASNLIPSVAPFIGGYSDTGTLTSPISCEFGGFFIGNASFNSDALVDAFNDYIA